MQINFLKYRKIYYFFSGLLILISIFSLVVYRLNFGIDFTGGTLMELDFKKDRISNEDVEKMLTDLQLKNLSLQQTGEKGLILKMENIDEETHQKILAKFNGDVEEKSFSSIGPVVGKELQRKTWGFTILVSIAIVLFIAFAFRHASRPISSWHYGIIASSVAFFHDVLIPLGIFSLLGKFYDVAVTIPIVVGLLTILGYSVHDTIVVFDRIRENLSRQRGSSFEEVVNKSLNQTIVRSINTSLTSLIVLVVMFFFGGETLRYFTLVLILGISTGTYSSIFIASPILVTWLRWRKKVVE
jgi:preprotein translocase subunit SecF